MSPDRRATSPASAPGERRPAVWPWLLLPLVALALFFALRNAKDAPLGNMNHAVAPAAAMPDGDVRSR
jgi:hypothetical protein